MSSHPADFRVEIIKSRPPGVGEVVDITDYVDLEAVGSVNRAVERDLFSFKTGDVTIGLLNHTEFFDDLFALFGATDLWSLRIFRRGEIQFWGLLIGDGSITFDRREKTVELTAYGLTKLLDRTSAEGVSRDIAAMTVTTATGGSASLTLNSTTGLLSGDILHLTDHANSEDVTVKKVTSATVVSLEAVLAHSYASGSPVECTTPFYRYKTISFLIEQLATEAGIGIAALMLSPSQFSRAAPTPVTIDGLPDLASFPAHTNPAQRNGRRYQTHGRSGSTDGTYYQISPDTAWVKEDSTQKPWIDWSRYYLQSETGPSEVLRDPQTSEQIIVGAGPDSCNQDPHFCGYDYKAASPIKYICRMAVAVNPGLWKQTYAAGSWGAITLVSDGHGFTNAPTYPHASGCEFDPARNGVYMWTTNAANPGFAFYDVVGATWTSCRTGSDTNNNHYGGFVYVPELDCVIGLRSAADVPSSGSTAIGFTVVAYRGTVKLWERSFPTCYIEANPFNASQVWPTTSLRYLDGILYCIAVIDGKAQLIWSADQFVTHDYAGIGDPGTGARLFAARINNAYQIICYSGSEQRGQLIAAPFYAGVIPYADFKGNSIAEADKKLAVLVNAASWVDDDCQFHFVARDLYDPGAIIDIDDLVLEETEDIIWEDTSQYVTVSGGGFEATAGDAAFAAEGIEVDSPFIPNEAYAQAEADALFIFYSKARIFGESRLVDLDGRIFQPLDRVRRNGRIETVHESDHDLISDEIQLARVEG